MLRQLRAENEALSARAVESKSENEALSARVVELESKSAQPGRGAEASVGPTPIVHPCRAVQFICSSRDSVVRDTCGESMD